MSYRVRRIDPFWFKNPLLPAAALGGVLLALGAGFAGKPMIAIAGAVVAAGAIVASTKPAVTATMLSLGLIGGLVTFVVSPSAQNASLSATQKAMSVSFYTVFYAVLTAGALLLFCVVYNFFSALSGTGGLSLDLEDEGS